MQRVLGIGVALGMLAAFVSWMDGDDEFCDLARDDGLVAGPLESREQRKDFRDRLDDAAEAAPTSIAGEVEALRDAADRRPRSTGSGRLADERAEVDDWVEENCT